MLKIAVMSAVSAIAIAGLAPMALPMLNAAPPQPQPQPPPPPPPAPVALAAPAGTPTARRSAFAREASVRADGAGQYLADAVVNGRSVRMLIDTGANVNVVSAQTAARLGLQPALGRPRVRAQTANGMAELTPTTLSTFAVGAVFTTDMPALIADASAGEVNLIGTEFLKRLSGVEQRDGWLYLRQ